MKKEKKELVADYNSYKKQIAGKQSKLTEVQSELKKAEAMTFNPTFAVRGICKV